MTRTYSLTQAAALAGRSERSVWGWLRDRKVKGEKSGKSWLVDADSLIAFARAHGIAVRGDNGGSLPPPALPVRPTERAAGGPRGHFTFRELGAYEALRAPAVGALRYLNSASAVGANEVAARGRTALYEALEHLAVGYNSYHLREKVAHYGRAREATCAAVSSLVVVGDLAGDAEGAAALADRLERESVGAIAGLIRSMELKEQKRGRRAESRE